MKFILVILLIAVLTNQYISVTNKAKVDSLRGPVIESKTSSEPQPKAIETNTAGNPPKTIDVSPNAQLKLVPPNPPSKEEEKYWETFFTKKRTERCIGDTILRYELIKMGIGEDLTMLRKGPTKHKFSWVKQWGYGQVAYLFDYLDPVLRPLILIDFNKIYDAFIKYPGSDSEIYKDPFNFDKPIPKDLNDEAKEALTNELLDIKKRIDPEIFKKSINAVQINYGVKENRWFIDKTESDYAKSFIKEYDMNGDGRLSPREFILASIWSNKKILSSDDCKLCYADLVDKIDGMFRYIDCDQDGLISSKDIYTNLPALRRETSKWNYFSLSNQANIRTAVSNDFILKNMSAKKGMLNKNEFRLGLLLGFWDRQTDDYRIIMDDSRNLKQLRWKDGDIVDIIAMKYIENKLRKEAEIRAQRPIHAQIIIPQSQTKPNGESEMTFDDPESVHI